MEQRIRRIGLSTEVRKKATRLAHLMHTSHLILIHLHCLFDIFDYCDCSELMVLCQLFLAIASFHCCCWSQLKRCGCSLNATDANCKVYCRDNGYDTTLDGSVGGSVYEYENSWTGAGSHSCICKNMDSFDMTTVCQTIVSTASPTATPVPCNVSDLEAARADDGSVPTCASMGITKITCHEACGDSGCGNSGSTWSWGASDAIGRCECGTFDFDIYWLCADRVEHQRHRAS
eukprot:scaffold6345_cov107-Skeletonema_dohrnii-CCMP3373.AAC.4